MQRIPPVFDQPIDTLKTPLKPAPTKILTKSLCAAGTIVVVGSLIALAIAVKQGKSFFPYLGGVGGGSGLIIAGIAIAIFSSKQAKDHKRNEVQQLPIEPIISETAAKELKKPVIFSDPSQADSPKVWLEQYEGKKLDELEIELLLKGRIILENAAKNLDPKNEQTFDIFMDFAVQLKRLVAIRNLIEIKTFGIQNGYSDQTSELLSDWKNLLEFHGENFLPGKINEVKSLLKRCHEMDQAFVQLENGGGKSLGGNEILIEQKYPVLKHAREDSSELEAQRMERKNRLYGKLWIALTAQKRGIFSGTVLEGRIIKYLGYDREKYLDKEALHQKMKIILDEILKDESKISPILAQLKEKVASEATEARLKNAGVPAENREKVKLIFAEASKIQSEILARLNKIKFLDEFLPEEDQRQHPKIANLFLEKVQKIQDLCIKQLIKTFVEHVNANSDLIEEVSQRIIARFDTKIFPNWDALIKRKLSESELLKWYKKYKEFIAIEFMQGTESNEALGDGVCLAFLYRIIKTIIKDPSLEDNELEADRITPTDRNNQAYYRLANLIQGASDKQKESARQNPELNKESELEWSNSESVPSNENTLQKLSEIVNGDQKQLHGIILCALYFVGGGGHAVLLQVDNENRKYRIQDPNLCMLSFPPEKLEGQDPVQFTLNAYIDLMKAKYDDDIESFVFNSLIKASELPHTN